MTERKINEVFLDELTGKRLKCVEGRSCGSCYHVMTDINTCIMLCEGRANIIFIQTDEPLTVQP